MQFPVVLISLFTAVGVVAFLLYLWSKFWAMWQHEDLLWFYAALFLTAAVIVYVAAFVFYPLFKELLL